MLLTDDNKSILSNAITIKEDKSVSSFDDIKSSKLTVKIIEVKEISESQNQIKSEGQIEHADQSHIEEKIISENNDNITKEGEKEEDSKNIAEAEEEDILSLEEILNREVEKLSPGGVCWSSSRDKKRTLCTFYVR